MTTAVDRTPLGVMSISTDGSAITSLRYGEADDFQDPAHPLLQEAWSQLQAWFAGRRQTFDLPLAPRGSSFQQRVWTEMLTIPFGQTLTYGAIAGRLGSSARAVGTACGRNPLPIFIPCHRIVAAQTIGGYSGGKGLATKRWLLSHEGIDRWGQADLNIT